MKHKFIKHRYIFAATALSFAVANAATTVPGDVNITPGGGEDGNVSVAGDATVNGTLTVKQPDPAAVSDGTAPAASLPIGNEKNTGFTDPGTMGTTPDPSLSGNAVYTYSTNGSGSQTQTVQTNGGAVITNAGNATLSETTTQTNTAVYTIETREIKISNPAGYTDVAGTYGPAGTFYANGTTLPGTNEDVATFRDADGNLTSVISDLPGVGPIVNVDGDGDPILSEAQVTAATPNAPAEFFTTSDPVVTPNTGNLIVEGNTTLGNSLTDTTNVSGDLTVGGQATTNGLDNSGEAITNIADGTAATDAASVGQVTAAVNAEAATREAADIVLPDNINTEAASRAAADVVLQDNINTEAATRAAADVVLQDNINTEAATRAAADEVLQDNIDAEVADRSRLITSVGQNADGNEIIHIGPHSLVTQELGGQQLLSAENALGNPIDIRVTGGSNLIVDGMTTTNGINNSGQRITNVGDGIAPGDAVNVRQLSNETSARLAGDRHLENKIDTNTRGIAMVAAMTNTTVAPDMKQAVDFNWANFEGENGFGLGYAYRINPHLQLNAAAASTTDFDESVVRLGVSYQW